MLLHQGECAVPSDVQRHEVCTAGCSQCNSPQSAQGAMEAMQIPTSGTMTTAPAHTHHHRSARLAHAHLIVELTMYLPLAPDTEQQSLTA